MMRVSTSPSVLAALSVAALAAGAQPQDPIAVADTGVLVRTDGVRSSAYSRDNGATWLPLPAPRYELRWRDRSFDPKVGDPGIPPTLLSDRSNTLFYVQFVTDIIPEYAKALDSLGAEYTKYYPNQAYIVRIAREGADAARQLPFVRAVMDVEVGHKLDTEIQRDLLTGALATARYNIVLVDKRRDAAALENRIEGLGGKVEVRAEGGLVVEATLSPEQLLAIARENTVLWIDRWSAPEYDMDLARIQSGANYVETVAGLDGKGIRGHINEGVHATHAEFAARPPYREAPIGLINTSSNSHGTNTAGEIYAQGLAGGVKGMLPFGQMMFTNHAPNRYTLVQTLQDPADIYRAMIMTQSWGGSRTTSYTSISALLDDILFDFPRMFATNSQSNAGARPSRPEAWAKNVCGIGGFLHRSNTNAGDDCWCSTGSIGPAQDGRVGPSFTGYYEGIRTTSGSTGYTNGFGGTSGATPMVNGLSGLAIQMLTDGHFGYPAVSWDQRFDARPNLTTTRVLLSLGTHQLNFTGSNSAQRVQQGWGFPNVQDLYDNRNNILLSDEQDVLTFTGQSRNYLVWVKPDTSEFRASMHHLEDAAAPSAIPTRINSLDLRVVDPNGNVYWGNGNGILAGPWSAPGGSANDVDIHENVFVPDPAPGVWRATVTAAAIRADNHRETGAVDVDFALAIRGTQSRDRSGLALDLVSSVPGQLDVSLTNLPAGWTAGKTLFSFNTSKSYGNGTLFGVYPDPVTEKIFSAPAAAGNVTSFTNSTNPAHYPNAVHSFNSTVAAELQGSTIDAVVVLFDANDRIIGVSNVARVTVN